MTETPGQNSTFNPLRLIKALGYSFQGLAAAVRHEAAFRQEVLAAAVLIPLGLWLGADGAQRALLAGSVLLVLVVEMINSAIEVTVDRISREEDSLAKRAKDMGSAAVLIALVNAAVVWLLVLLN